MPPATYVVDQRTRVLTAPGLYLSTADAWTLTGHAPVALSRLAREGAFLTRQVGSRSFSYQTASVIDYCRKQNITVALTDLLATAEGEPIIEEQLATELDGARSGTWWTLARREQSPPDWPSWQHWYTGHTRQAQKLLAQQRSRWVRQVKEYQAGGVVRRTLWLPSKRLSAFGEYCLARFEHVVAAGGSVQVLPAWKVAYLEDRDVLPDLEVTPGAVYVRRHTRVGSRDGGLRITDPHLVDSIVSYLGWVARQHAISLSDFAQWHHRGAA